MADLMFVFVEEDTQHTQALADMLDDAGFTIHAGAGVEVLDACEVIVIVWSYAATRCPAFVKQAARAAQSGKAVIAHLDGPVLRDTPADVEVVHLWNWDGVCADDPALDRLLFAVDQRIRQRERAYADTIPVAAPFEPEAFWVDEREPRGMSDAWSAPLPSHFIPPRPEPRSAPRRPQALAVTARALALAFVFGAGALIGNLQFNRTGAVVADAPPVTLSVSAASASPGERAHTREVVALPAPRTARVVQTVAALANDTPAPQPAWADPVLDVTAIAPARLTPLVLDAPTVLLEMPPRP